ncbi:MAG TPA: hypothetical protein VGB94_09610 [Acidobacteriaceae bacterium]
MSIVLPDMAAAAYTRSQHLSVLDAEGSLHPPHNYLNVADTLQKFKAEFLPLSPLIDPRGRKILIIKNNFPKFLNLRPMDKNRPMRAHTMIEKIETNTFVETEYAFERDRLQSLFWIPDIVCRPDAIYRKKKGFGVVEAEEVYVKVYKKQNVGSPVKVVFTHRIQGGKKKDWIVISSYFTSRSTAKLYTEGEPLWPVK